MKPFSNTELSSFCGQMALILKAGISSMEGLTIMLEDAASQEEKEILENLLSEMQETGSLYQSLDSIAMFPPYLLHMVEIGEETGTLDDVMEALKTHYEREDSIQKSIRSSVTYPMIMIGMMVVVIAILLMKVMPIFNQVFIQLGSEMTGFSRSLLKVGNVMNNYSIALVALLVVIVGFIFYGFRTNAGKKTFRKLSYKFKFTRNLSQAMAACRFASGMALTLKSGLHPERSMELVSALNEDPVFQEKLNRCQQSVSSGSDLTDSLQSSGVFAGIYARMASIGEKTGSLDQVMDEIAGLYQDEIDTRMNNLLAVIEPTLVVALSLIVGVILLSVMLPLMGIMSSL